MSHSATPIMVAPSGARLNKSDHPAIPVTIAETIDSTVDAMHAGAHALHAHVRDNQQKHLLDASAYRQLLDLAANKLGSDFPVQITTETFGMYTAAEQIALVKELKPKFASVCMREIIRDDSHVEEAQSFYQWCVDERIAVQHIVFGQTDLEKFQACQSEGIIPANQKAVLMVIGRYTESNVADEEESLGAVKALSATDYHWMLCAFGKTETDCLVQAVKAGGGARVGFENNRENTDGSIAASNAERVSALVTALGNQKRFDVNEKVLHQFLGA